MSLGLNNALQQRAKLLAQLRDFFKQRDVLEVETPLLASTAGTDIYIKPIATERHGFLQTSPEFAMKKLLAAGSGSIYQICKAFRDEEHGRLHRNEFTILEWYRVGFDHHDLMLEISELLSIILKIPKATKISYQQLFEKHLDLNPHTANIDDYELGVLLATKIEPHLSANAPVIIYDFPKTQAALAKLRIRDDGITVAERFEVYVKGVELANGYNELQDHQEQLQRFEHDNALRVQQNKPTIPIDKQLIAALKKGLPQCAGVALGVDRLLMLSSNSVYI